MPQRGHPAKHPSGENGTRPAEAGGDGKSQGVKIILLISPDLSLYIKQMKH